MFQTRFQVTTSVTQSTYSGAQMLFEVSNPLPGNHLCDPDSRRKNTGICLFQTRFQVTISVTMMFAEQQIKNFCVSNPLPGNHLCDLEVL